MRFNPGVFDIWVFRRNSRGVEFLLLHASQVKADRHFNGGRFWQIPSGACQPDEGVLNAIDRVLAAFGFTQRTVWAAEWAYTIYNRRFEELQMISVYAVEVDSSSDSITLDPSEHAELEWLPYEVALERVHFRGLKDGLRSTHEYITGVEHPAPELRLR